MNFKNSIASMLHKAGLSADFVTYLGLCVAAFSGYLIYTGEFMWGGGCLLLAGGLDLMDGAIARLSNKVSKFGGVLDSSLDRYGDFFVLAGLLLFYVEMGDVLYSALTLSAMAGSFEISYVRARAECVVPQCKVGFWERGERLVYLSLGLMLDNPETAVWVLAIGTHMTALFRLREASRLLNDPGSAGGTNLSAWDIILHRGRRARPLYLAKCVLWFLLLLFVHPVV